MEIRAFDGTLGDARGIIAVDEVTFGDCRYTPEYIVDLVKSANQCVWVAETEEGVAGFVSAFATHSLAADRWEIDELAVRPSAQRQGIGTALVGHALAGAPSGALARTVIAKTNVASQRAFTKNRFAPVAEVHLLVRDVAKPLSIAQVNAVSVSHASLADAELLARLSKSTTERVRSCLGEKENDYLIAASTGTAPGYAELLAVRTLHYTGFWLEAIQSAGQNTQVSRALLDAAVELAQNVELNPRSDLVGHLALPEKSTVYQDCLEREFTQVGEYQTWVLTTSDLGHAPLEG
jgi:GNAT superfamily N-acetyltransferase